MRQIVLVIALAAAAATGARGQMAVAPQPASPAPCCVVAAGTLVEIELTQLLSSKAVTPGDRFGMRLVGDLDVSGVILMPAGTRGVGEVVDSAPAGLAGRPGKLILAARALDLGPIHLPLRSFRLSGTGRDNSKAVGLLSATPYIGILAMGMHGGNIDYPAGTHAVAKVAADTFIASPALPLAPPISAAPAPMSSEKPL